MQNNNYLVWIDLEMTGLSVENDTILEIATIITDNTLRIIAEGPHFIIHHSDAALSKMDQWCIIQHGKSGLTEASRRSKVTLQEAEQKTVEFLNHYCFPKTAPLCGNSVYQDRNFLRKYMPSIDQYLHYRIIDVTSVKECIRRWYPNNSATEFKKSDSHRALDDIKESINELAHYRANFFK
jgi:oligoribonuclease